MSYGMRHKLFIAFILTFRCVLSYAQNPTPSTTNAYGSADTIVKRFTYSDPHYYASERTQRTHPDAGTTRWGYDHGERVSEML